MSTLKISDADWAILKVKLRRKYNHLSEEDLAYHTGDEEQLFAKLSKRLRRNKEYILFTLAKELKNLESNSL